MKLKKEYMDLSLNEICLKVINEIYNNKIPKKWLYDFEYSFNSLNSKNCTEIYITLYILANKCKENNIKICVIGKWKSILDNIYVTFPLLVQPFNEYVHIKIRDIDIKKNNVILESADSMLIAKLLNEICTDWEDTFIIKKCKKIKLKGDDKI